MRVACIVPGDIETTSGGFRYDRRLVASLRDAGDDVSVHSVPWRRYPFGVVDGPLAACPDRWRAADVVLVDELAHPTFAGVRFDRWETPVVALVHHLRCDEGGPETPLARALERRFLSRVDGVVCTSSATQQSVRDLLGRPRERTLPTLVAPPVDDQFESDVTPTDVDARATDDPFRVVFLGALVPRKRPLALVDALSALDPTHDWRATLVGPHPDDRFADRVRRHCRRRGVDDRVRLTGRLPTDEVASVLRRGHALALPSAHEGFGIAALEGMGFGLPAVVTDSGGATDLVTHGETGFLLPSEGVGALYAALSTLAADRSRLARMGRAALDRARSWPAWSESAERIRALLRHVVDGDSSATATRGLA